MMGIQTSARGEKRMPSVVVNGTERPNPIAVAGTSKP